MYTEKCMEMGILEIHNHSLGINELEWPPTPSHMFTATRTFCF